MDSFVGGYWFYYLDKTEVQGSRDPFGLQTTFDDDPSIYRDGHKYMRPWYTPLTTMGGPQKVAMIYDAREDRIWMIPEKLHCGNPWRRDGLSDEEG